MLCLGWSDFFPLFSDNSIDKQTKKQAQLDERLRNHVEGKFGQAKRGFSLGKVMAKLSETSTTAIELRSAARSQLLF
ncbi:hypothetical protein D5R40_23815 [Okeania hirsuta]|uniref:Transposase DDE domain-containing protein n=1 Tax=Okeania hirsuta TaxID=1458930 RepID=A0A3N6P6B1_9CYAN|nr:transposase [Okeania sp. SIO2B9]RQH30649.1 hypothetical protein D5R40_23815 [Okeania hirsuta]